MKPFEIFCACPPGLEPILEAEALEAGFKGATATAGGVSFFGLWPNVMRANLTLRGTSRILARFAHFRSFNLSQLEKQTRELDWHALLRKDVPVKVDVTTRKSKIYHAGAAKERIERAIHERMRLPIGGEDAIKIMVRIEDNLCTFSVDTSGTPLHQRGHKEAVGKAPMRENLASLFLRAAGFDGTEPVLDPMCGSGTFPIEAAEIAHGLLPGRSRAFAFEHLASFMPERWAELKSVQTRHDTQCQFYGSDRNPGAIDNAKANANRAGVGESCLFTKASISDLECPKGAAGLLIMNPPYGARIGDKKQLFALYGALGKTLKTRFKGWRVAIITTDMGLAQTTGLPFTTSSAPIPHGGLKVRLHQTKRLT
ncbi:THUMP domain-containing class I SAM-dependent RNA methyltransferase [Planktotalea sp.]|uniref:THUMP domain-containing class I SAM-dependent RNA methyltransferase n=1 Tax=Planktotalea sp. TaxID=2029877 RepID=UPI003D6B9D19